MAKRTARKTARAAASKAASRSTKRRAGTGKKAARKPAVTSAGRTARKVTAGSKKKAAGAPKAIRNVPRKATAPKRSPDGASRAKAGPRGSTAARRGSAHVTTPRPEPRKSPAPPAVTSPRRSKRRPTPAPVPVVDGRNVGDDEPLDDVELDAPETPTSFNLDLRRARKAEAAIDDRVEVDLNSTMVLAAGDHDVSPESAATVGDETPGGDNPTPDMDVVDLIGRSLGVEYEDNEELKGAEKIVERDKKRWELDPASAEDYKERSKS